MRNWKRWIKKVNNETEGLREIERTWGMEKLGAMEALMEMATTSIEEGKPHLLWAIGFFLYLIVLFFWSLVPIVPSVSTLKIKKKK